MEQVVLEHLTISASDGLLHLTTEVEGLPEGADPVQVGFSRIPQAVLAHSTSWRYQDDRIILTFVHVLADRAAVAPAWSGSAEELEALPVACHAVRHLHFLRHTDDDIAQLDGLDAFWDLAARVSDHHYPAVAGLLAHLEADSRVDYVI